jgi:hypothetical protein
MIYYIFISLIVILSFHISVLYKKLQHINEKLTLINDDKEIKNLDKNLSLDDETFYVNIMDKSVNDYIDFNNYFIPSKIEKLNIIYNRLNKCGIYIMNDEYFLINPSIHTTINLDKLKYLNNIKIDIGKYSNDMNYFIDGLWFNNLEYLEILGGNIDLNINFNEFKNINTQFITLSGDIYMNYLQFIKCFLNLKNIKIICLKGALKNRRIEDIKSQIEEHCKKHNCILEFI